MPYRKDENGIETLEISLHANAFFVCYKDSQGVTRRTEDKNFHEACEEAANLCSSCASSDVTIAYNIPISRNTKFELHPFVKGGKL